MFDVSYLVLPFPGFRCVRENHSATRPRLTTYRGVCGVWVSSVGLAS